MSGASRESGLLPSFGTRGLFLFVTACCVFLAFRQSGLPLAGCTCLLAFGLKLVRAKSELTVVAGVWIAGFGGMGVVLSMVFWWWFGLGPIYSQDAWPKEVIEMHRLSEASHDDVYVRGIGDVFEVNYVYRLSLPSDRLDAIRDEFGLKPTVLSAEGRGESWSRFLWWWRPWGNSTMRHRSIRYFRGDRLEFSTGTLIAAYDETAERLYVYQEEFPR